MLQDCPSLIQPQASFTRKNSISEDATPSLQDGDTNQTDAEASSILIGFANQEQDKTNNYSVIFHRLEPLLHSSTTTTFLFENNNNKIEPSIKDTKVTLPIKTYNNLHLQKKREQPDPIQLLAAAAAVIDEGRYKGRFYERREIRLQTRPSSLLKKSPNIRHQTKSSGSLISDRQDTSEIEIGNESQSEGTHVFSWQYMSMRQNPRIKRNAMHAYITYMIYTDLTHESTKKKKSDNKQKRHKMESQPITTASEEGYRMQTNSWHSMQPYRIQSQDLSTSTVAVPNGQIIGRPLTDFLFEQRGGSGGNSTNGILLPPPATRATVYSD